MSSEGRGQGKGLSQLRDLSPSSQELSMKDPQDLLQGPVRGVSPLTAGTMRDHAIRNSR